VSDSVQYRQMLPGEEQIIYELVERVFNEFVAQGYEAAGVAGFLDYAAPDLLEQRSENDHFVLVATMDEAIVGMVEVREHRHISLFFVDSAWHGRGIGRQLMSLALARCQKENPALAELTVNSSLYALTIYQHLGFRQAQPVQEDSGLRYIPMVRVILPEDSENAPA